MLAQVMPRQPAPMLARGAPWLRLDVRPTAFGNALGNGIVDSMVGNERIAALDESSRREAGARWDAKEASEAGQYGQGLFSGSSARFGYSGSGRAWLGTGDNGDRFASESPELTDESINYLRASLGMKPPFDPTRVEPVRLAALDINEGDPTPLRLRPPAELRDAGRSAWNGLVKGADFLLMMGRGALRGYEKNPDGSPNLKSVTAPILDGFLLDYESEPYRSGGLSFFGETLTQVVAPSALARLPGAIRGLAGEIRGVGVPDWNIQLGSPYQLNIGVPLEFERISSGWVNPSKVNFTQPGVSGNVRQYVDDMVGGNWDWQRSGPLRVMDVDGQLVSYDNRRLMAARIAGLDEVPIQIVDPLDIMPGSKKTWQQAFDIRRNMAINRVDGAPVPRVGLPDLPRINPPKRTGP